VRLIVKMFLVGIPITKLFQSIHSRAAKLVEFHVFPKYCPKFFLRASWSRTVNTFVLSVAILFYTLSLKVCGLSQCCLWLFVRQRHPMVL